MTHNCRNNFNHVEYSITFHGIESDFGGRWVCKNPKKKTYSDFIIFDVVNGTKESVTPTYTVSTPGAPRYSHSSITTTEHNVIGGTSTVADNDSSLGGNSLTPVIGAAAGGVFVLISVITIIAVVVKKKSNRGRNGGSSDREKITVDEYAQIGALGHRNSIDEVNPIYEGTDKDIFKPITCEGGDVYSVVQKPKKVETQSADTDEQRTEDVAGDVYSVVQKPKKSQPTSTDSTTPRNEVTDIYSVVQKPSSR